MRQRRFKCGALQLNQVKPKFTLAETTGLPIGLEPAITFPANKLVEEWMLAANEAVATLIASRLPRTAFLRRHPAPTRRQLEEAHTILDFSGVKVNITSAATIQVIIYLLLALLGTVLLYTILFQLLQTNSLKHRQL